jgi:hypothetical protein
MEANLQHLSTREFHMQPFAYVLLRQTARVNWHSETVTNKVKFTGLKTGHY